jgi:hypothetical protein
MLSGDWGSGRSTEETRSGCLFQILTVRAEYTSGSSHDIFRRSIPKNRMRQVRPLLLKWSRYTALIFAVGLGIGEAVINWGHWQFAPLWIVDYVIVVWLLTAFYKTRSGDSLAVLISGWAFTSGVFYMALFISLDPELTHYINPNSTILVLISVMLGIAVLGILTSALANRKHA